MSKIKTAGKPKSAATSKKPRKATPLRETTSTKPRVNSKQADVIEMLRQPQGATIPAIMKVTAWQPHLVRGFFAGVVRKKLGLKLESAKPEDGDHVYRIIAGKPDKPKSSEKPGRRVA
jgi:hypothetical protein